MAMQEISDETRVIEPVGVVKPMPLDVPRVNGFKQGYEPAAAERLVADLRGRLAAQTRFADEYRSALDKARGDIRGAEARIDDLKRQVAELRHTADSPFEAAGKAGQALLDAARAQGAKVLARRQVIVKELPAIQNLGAMDVLCCDKTGTLTDEAEMNARLTVEQAKAREKEISEAAAKTLADAKERAAELEKRNRAECDARTRAADEATARAADARAKATAMLDSLSGSLADLKAGLKA